MSKIVEITQSSDMITCDEKGQAIIQFNVTNITGNSLRVGVDITTKGSAKKSWFTLDGKSEKQLDSNATDQFSVSIKADQGDSEVTGKLGILVYSVDNADEDYTESEPISIIVPPKKGQDAPEPPNNKWIIWVIVGVIILALLGVIGYLLVKGNGDDEPKVVAVIPNVEGKPFEQAKQELENLDFSHIETETRFSATQAKNTVLEQMPDAGTKSDPASTDITLILSDSTTALPDVTDMTYQGAMDKLKNKGFRRIKKEPKFNPNKPKNTVLAQSPESGSNYSIQQVVTLTVADPGISVPNVKNKSLSNALKTLQQAQLTLGKLSTETRQNINAETVIDQTPKAGKKVEKSTEINLVVSKKKTNMVVFHPILMKTVIDSGIKFNPQIRRELEPAPE